MLGGGIARAAGRGVVVFPTRTQEGGTVLVFDQAVLIRKSQPSDSSVRILSSTRMRRGGLRTVQLFDSPGALVCRDTQQQIPLVEKGGILVLETVKKRASNYRNNRELLAALDLYRKGKGPPYVVLHPRTYAPTHRILGGVSLPLARAAARKLQWGPQSEEET